jgi:hypothetical protein
MTIGQFSFVAPAATGWAPQVRRIAGTKQKRLHRRVGRQNHWVRGSSALIKIHDVDIHNLPAELADCHWHRRPGG